MPAADGPDVSHYNRVTNEALVPRFRVASCKLGEGRSYFDPTCPSWLALFRRKGVRYIGVYYWLRSDSPVETQFNNMVARLKQCGLETGGVLDAGVFLQLDWETTPGIAPLTVAQVEEFETLTRRRYGDRMIVYSSDWVPGFTQWRTRNPGTPLWYANYNLGATPAGGPAECKKWRADLWQWTSSYKCPGFAWDDGGGIDMNEVCPGGWEVLDRLCALTSAPTPVPPTPTPVPVPVDEEETDMVLITNKEQFFTAAPGIWKALLLSNGKLRYISTTAEYFARAGANGAHEVAWSNAEISAAGVV